MSTEALLPVVLVHGLVGSLDEPPLLEALHPGAVLAPDLLGYGSRSSVSPQRIHLGAQAKLVAGLAYERFGARPVQLVGHSVGAVVAALLAHAAPERVASLVSVEGNFTLRDAFWSAQVGRMDEDEASAMLEGFRANPGAWLARSGVAPTPGHLTTAVRWLAHQPASTLRAMGQSVVETTGNPAYEAILRVVFSRTPVHLLAGERSAWDWDVARPRPHGLRGRLKRGPLSAGPGGRTSCQLPSTFRKRRTPLRPPCTPARAVAVPPDMATPLTCTRTARGPAQPEGPAETCPPPLERRDSTSGGGGCPSTSRHTPEGWRSTGGTSCSRA